MFYIIFKIKLIILWRAQNEYYAALYTAHGLHQLYGVTGLNMKPYFLYVYRKVIEMWLYFGA